MRRADWFAVLVAVFLLGAGAYLSTFPTEVIRTIGLLLMAGAVIGLVIWFASGRRRKVLPPIGPSEWAVNGAIGAVTVAWLAAVFRGRKIAIAAAFIATAAIIFDLFFTWPPRTIIWMSNNPWGWLSTPIMNQDYKTGRYLSLVISGQNLSKSEVRLDDAYYISGITGAEVHLKIWVQDKGNVPIGDINPISRGAVAVLTMDFPAAGITRDDFLKAWGPFSLVVIYDGKMDRINFSRQQTIQIVEPRPSEPRPYVTLKQKQ